MFNVFVYVALSDDDDDDDGDDHRRLLTPHTHDTDGKCVLILQIERMEGAWVVCR